VVSIVTDVPATVHTDDVVDENVTASPDDAVALIVTGDWVMAVFEIAGNVIVWFALAIVNVCCTDGAALYVALPAWSAWIVHVPVVSSVTDVPLALHTDGVVDENVTASPDVAVAETVTGDWVMVAFGIAGNVIVWSTFVGITVKLCCTDGAAL
jgi:hypothetical protein